MDQERGENCYNDDNTDELYFYLEETRIHEITLRFLQNILPSTFKTYVDKIWHSLLAVNSV